MRLISFKIKHDEKRFPIYTLVPLGDIHVGNINADLKKFEEIVNWIKDKEYTYWLGMGDYADAITAINDNRFDTATVDKRYLTPDEQYEYILKQFTKIRDKCIALLTGNHDDKLRKYGGHDYVKELAYELNVEYLGWSGFINLNFENKFASRRRFKVFAAHGYYRGTTIGGKINKVLKLREFVDADIYLMAHTHEIAGMRKEVITSSNGKNSRLINKKLVFALTGGFLRTYMVNTTSYGEQHLYAPSKIGIITIEIDPNRGDLHVKE